MEMIRVSLVLKTFMNGIWVFMDDSDAETREYDQTHETCRAQVFHLSVE